MSVNAHLQVYDAITHTDTDTNTQARTPVILYKLPRIGYGNLEVGFKVDMKVKRIGGCLYSFESSQRSLFTNGVHQCLIGLKVVSQVVALKYGF